MEKLQKIAHFSRKFLFSWVLVLAAFCMLQLESDAKISTDYNNSPAWMKPIFQQSWNWYKTRMMINGERVNSNTYGPGDTISEGQSYAMMRALFMNDRPTFDKSWNWTKQNLQVRNGDKLFAWRWGRRANGSNGVIHTEMATDADQDIAWALLEAHERWGDRRYLNEAQPIISDLYKHAVKNVHGRSYLAASDWTPSVQNTHLSINPSYFAPYVYRKFARYDRANANGWQKLANDIYPTLEACANLTSHKMAPNFCGVRYDNGQIVFTDVFGDNARDHSYDAVRVNWRMAMDSADGSGPAKFHLQRRNYLLNDFYRRFKTLPDGFAWNGPSVGPMNSGFGLSEALVTSHTLNPNDTQKMFNEMLAPQYVPEHGYFANTYNDFLQSVIFLNLWAVSQKF